MSGGIFVSGRVIDRFTRRSKHGLCARACRCRWPSPFRSISLSSGRRPGRSPLLFLIGPTFLNYFYLSSSRDAGAGGSAAGSARHVGRVAAAGHEFDRHGLGPTYVGAVSDFFRASHPHHSLQLAFYALVPFYGVAIVLFLWLARVLRREKAKTGAIALMIRRLIPICAGRCLRSPYAHHPMRRRDQPWTRRQACLKGQ